MRGPQERWRTWVLALLPVTACEATDLAVQLRPPWGSDATGVIVGVRSDQTLLPGTPVVVGAGERVRLTGPDAPVRLEFLEYPEATASDLMACGVRVGGNNRSLPAPNRAWALTIDPLLAEQGTPQPAAPPGRDLRFDRCEPVRPCARVKLEVEELPLTGLNPVGMVGLPGERWLVTAQASGSTVGPTRAGLREADGRFESLPLVLPNTCPGVVWDRADRVYLACSDLQLHAIELAPPARLGPVEFLGTTGRLVSRPDGLVLLLSPGAVRIIQQPPGGGVASEDFPSKLDDLVMLDADRMAALQGPNLLLYDPSDGRWEPSFVVPQLHFENRLIYAGGVLFVFGPTFGFVLDPSEGWTALPALPSGLSGPRAPLAFGGGVILGGDIGGAAYWLEGEWCFLETSGIYTALRASGVSPDGASVAFGADPRVIGRDPTWLRWRPN